MFLLCCNHFYGRGDTKEGIGEHDVLTSIFRFIETHSGNTVGFSISGIYLAFSVLQLGWMAWPDHLPSLHVMVSEMQISPTGTVGLK